MKQVQYCCVSASPGDELQYVKFDVPPLQLPFTIVASTLPLLPPLQLTSLTRDKQSVGTKGLSTIVALSKRELHPFASVIVIVYVPAHKSLATDPV